MRDLEWLDPLPDLAPDPELEQYWMRTNGVAAPHTRYFGPCPWILHADAELDIGFIHINDIADQIYLVISRDNSCRFCYGASRALMRMAGTSEKRIRALEEDVDLARLDPKTRLAFEYARRVSRANPAPDATERKKLLEAGYPENAIKELAFFASDVGFHNRFSTLLALPPRRLERLGRAPWVYLGRLFTRKLLARVQTPGRLTPLPDSARTGPYSEVVVGLEGLPHAPVLSKVLDEAWASPHLKPRSKALIFAVIARGLGSLPAEREAWRLLAEQGVEPAQAEKILAHLGSPDLDPVEAQILPYVRETIRYQPAAIQRRGRELRKHISNAQLLDTVGLAALANMVCRLATQLETA